MIQMVNQTGLIDNAAPSSSDFHINTMPTRRGLSHQGLPAPFAASASPLWANLLNLIFLFQLGGQSQANLPAAGGRPAGQWFSAMGGLCIPQHQPQDVVGQGQPEQNLRCTRHSIGPSQQPCSFGRPLPRITLRIDLCTTQGAETPAPRTHRARKAFEGQHCVQLSLGSAGGTLVVEARTETTNANSQIGGALLSRKLN